MTLARALAILAVLACPAACARQPGRESAEQAILRRRVEGLETLAALAERRQLVDLERLLVVVDQHLVQDLLDAALPFERDVGRVRVRVESGAAAFADGFASIRLDGRASLPGEDVWAEVSVYGGLDVFELDPESGVLRTQLDVFSVEAPRLSVMGVGASARRVVEALGRERLEAYGALLSQLEVPVKIEQNITLPAVTGERVQIPAARVPLRAAVSEVRVFSGKLWISVDADVGAEAQRPPVREAGGQPPTSAAARRAAE